MTDRDAIESTVDIQAAVALLDRNGYLVVKIPTCRRAGTGHGAHTLITRSARCSGEEPIPHGVVGVHRGTFDWWTSCACGGSFNSSDWDVHVREHGIVVNR